MRNSKKKRMPAARLADRFLSLSEPGAISGPLFMEVNMPDYEDLILQRQEEIEIYEDDPDSWEVLYGHNKRTDQRDPEACQSR